MTHRGMTRRTFVADLGKGTLAVAVFGLTAVACGSDQADQTTAAGSETSTTSAPSPTSEPPPATEAVPDETPSTTVAETALSWERVNLGFVSAYVLARAGEATIVDTGVSGSENDIGASLGVLGLGWEDVGHVIVTHLHNDHQGSLPAVLDLAPAATGYAGAADIPGISSPRELVPVGDGDRVFDLDIIATPGHTPGHISVLDSTAGLLVAGDALNGADGGVIGANPRFTDDMAEADATVLKLAGLTYDTVVFGHGDPVVGNASQQVADLADSL